MLRHLTDDGKMKKPKAPKETPEEEWCAVCKVTITTGLKQHVLSHVSVEVTHFHFPSFFPLLITLSLCPHRIPSARFAVKNSDGPQSSTST